MMKPAADAFAGDCPAADHHRILSALVARAGGTLRLTTVEIIRCNLEKRLHIRIDATEPRIVLQLEDRDVSLLLKAIFEDDD